MFEIPWAVAVEERVNSERLKCWVSCINDTIKRRENALITIDAVANVNYRECDVNFRKFSFLA